MENKIRIYKVLNKNPSIYVELNEFSFPVDLDLYLDNILVDSVCNKNTYHIFKVTQPGVYRVAAKSHDSLKLNSNDLNFSKAGFQSGVSFKSSKAIGVIDFSVNEPEIDDINGFYVEIKIHKDRAKKIESILNNRLALNAFQKKVLNLNLFHEDHSIHKYEYYTTSNILSKEDAKNIRQK